MPKYKAPSPKKETPTAEKLSTATKTKAVFALLMLAFVIYTLTGGLDSYRAYMKTHFGLGWGMYVLAGITNLIYGVFEVVDHPNKTFGYTILHLGAIMAIIYPHIWDGNRLSFLIFGLIFLIPCWLVMLAYKSKFGWDPLGIRK